VAISLYDVSVGSYLQVLGGVAGFLEKGRTYCLGQAIDLGEVLETRLREDMLTFRFQVVSVVHHSLGALNGMREGVFQPPRGLADLDYEGLQRQVVVAREDLARAERREVDSLEGKDVVFRIGERSVPFTAENFVLSFSLPNLYFHAATAYDILRMKGAPIGKRDFMGQLRIKT
jgi:uncharacterized protein